MSERKSKILQGRIVSTKMQKTAVVEVTRLKRFPKYGKYVKISKKFKAHLDSNEYIDGDKVEIMETAPKSRDKRWKIIKLIERPESVSAEASGESDDTA
ncbi:30S ribosomal protein S17 [Candidatus Giovannonibacteria bacterium]|nr:30S ribosomal protein S17 [Candidatus Giovannonibacteria bacterium]